MEGQGFTAKFNAGGNPVMDLHPIQGEVDILIAICLMLENQE